jgi:hypothetical protein
MEQDKRYPIRENFFSGGEKSFGVENKKKRRSADDVVEEGEHPKLSYNIPFTRPDD